MEGNEKYTKPYLEELELIVATSNEHKISEFQSLCPIWVKLISSKHAGFGKEIKENYTSLVQNATKKAYTVYKALGKNVFADDSGLMVNSLGGQPGVHSSRYAGENATKEQNIEKLLKELENKTDRSAMFITVISLYFEGKNYLFKGEVHGIITIERRGTNGFGYDSVFLPENSSKTFAEMTDLEKSKISHRFFAFEKLLHFLNERKYALSWQKEVDNQLLIS
jgi:XTP/dITP diphosphohydrolase